MFKFRCWDDICQKFNGWWNQENQGSPLIYLNALNEGSSSSCRNPQTFFSSPQERYFNVEKICEDYRRYLREHSLMGVGFPNLNLNLGTTSIAAYLGCAIEPRWDTLWYRHLPDELWEDLMAGKTFLPTGLLEEHLKMVEKANKLAENDFLLTIPDIGGSMDVLSQLCGPQNLCIEILDRPDEVDALVRRLDAYYQYVYNLFYDRVCLPDRSSVFTAFKIWGPGKVAKLECDFCALLGPDAFREFVVPTIEYQCDFLDYAFYHLDGPDAVRHVDSLVQIEGLKAIQWSHGAGNRDGLWEGWYQPIYDKVIESGKSLYLFVDETDPHAAVYGIQKLVKRYGSHSLYLRFYNEMAEQDALQILKEIGEK